MLYHFCTITHSTGSFLEINEYFNTSITNNYLFSANTIYREDPSLDANGYWYGLFYSNSSGRQKVYRYEIKLRTEYEPTPGVVEHTVSLAHETNSYNKMAFDENKNMLLCSELIGNQIENWGYVCRETAAYSRTFSSLPGWINQDYNVVLTNENNSTMKAVISSLGNFQQYVDKDITRTMTPMPMIPLDYRAQLLNYVSSGNSLYPSQVTTEMLQEFSSAPLSNDLAKQGTIKGKGLWAVLTSSDSNVIDAQIYKKLRLKTDGA